MSAANSDPIIAVIIPVYKQSQYLKDSVVSVMRQSMRDRSRVVIVNDGCPYPSTDWLGRYFRDAYPGFVQYLKKPNGGLSSARNHGIRFALAAWPTVEAVFPLDADNKLSTTTLEKLWAQLAMAEPQIGWAYQDFTVFDREETTWATGGPFNVYRLIHENYCDAGSLIRRGVFDEDIWYDESMRSGYEDWEFFINAGLHGFRGIHVPDTDFLYRKQGHSMLWSARAKHEDICTYIRNKHRRDLDHNAKTVLEQIEMPRFALVDVSGETVRYATDPLETSDSPRTVAEFVGAVKGWQTESWPQSTYVPPIAVFAHRRLLDLLAELRVLPGLLFTLQKVLRRTDYATMTLELADKPHIIELASERERGRPDLFAMMPRKWIELTNAYGERVSQYIDDNTEFITEHFSLLVDSDLVHGRVVNDRPCQPDLLTASLSILRQVSESLNTTAISSRSGKQSDQGWRFPSHTEFAAWKHINEDDTGFPSAVRVAGTSRRPINIWFAAPWIRLGGVDLCALHLARELARHSPEYRLQLVLTERNEVEAHPDLLSSFNNIAFLPPDAHSKHSALLDILSNADVIIDAHSLAGYQLLPELKARSRAKFLSYLHVTDLDRHGNPCGYPLIAARDYPGLIDGFLVISQQMGRFCRNVGVPEEKIVLVPNAPAVAPASAEAALRIARGKCRRQYSLERPIRILFSGRFDHQKGIDRLAMIVWRLEQAGIPFVLDLVGKAVVSDSAIKLSAPNVKVRPPSMDPRVLTTYYSEADVFLLPSRWEGVPLAILEAMAFGNLVIATDVGAVNEAIENGKTGFLLDARQSEDELVGSVESIIGGIVANRRRFDELRLAACRRAMETSWACSAANVAAWIDEANL